MHTLHERDIRFAHCCHADGFIVFYDMQLNQVRGWWRSVAARSGRTGAALLAAALAWPAPAQVDAVPASAPAGAPASTPPSTPPSAPASSEAAVPTPDTLPAAVPLPNLGDSSEMSPVVERRLGDRIARELYQDPDYVDDPVVMEYVDGIWRSLIAASRARGEMSDDLYETYAWQILLGRDRTVNAFALPGGYFGLHLGLVAIVSSRDELASVLAHELSHVTQRHISRSMARQSAQAPWLIGSMIMGLLAAGRNPQGAQAVVMGGQAASVQSQLNYSRGMEREADRIGFNVSTQAGFAPQGFVSMFEKLQQSMRLNDAGGFPYLRTHPLTMERIADMQLRVQQSPVARRPDLPTQEHVIIAARARLLSNPDVDALRLWGQQAEPAALARQPEMTRIGILYGATLAAMHLHDYARAEATLQRLQSHPLEPQALRLVTMVGIDLALAQGQLTRASLLVPWLDVHQRASLLMRAQINTLTGRAEDAAQDVRTWLADHPNDPLAWQSLATAYGVQGRTASAVRAEAEVNAAQFDFAQALVRLGAAQDLVRKGAPGTDYIEASIIDTRRREIESRLKEQALAR